jgi:hypothetical protein
MSTHPDLGDYVCVMCSVDGEPNVFACQAWAADLAPLLARNKTKPLERLNNDARNAGSGRPRNRPNEIEKGKRFRGTERENRASCERLKSARQKGGAVVFFIVSLAAPFFNPFPSLSSSRREVCLPTTVCLLGLTSARGERDSVPRRLSLGRATLPWAAVMVIHSAATVPVRDGRGRGSACAKAVGTSTSRGVGTSVTARTPTVGGWSGAGKRRGGRRDDARTMPPKPSTPRRRLRAVSVPQLRHKHRRIPQLRLRVVTQQKFCCRRPCATGRGAMNHP